MMRPTEKTIKKNGLKWSNISVKKYHHSPGLGVRSGSKRLFPVSLMCRKVLEEEIYTEPHVCSTHAQFPVTRKEAAVSNRV